MPHSSIFIPWGLDGDEIDLAIPGDWPGAETVEPDRAGAVGDYAGALNRALDATIDGSSFVEGLTSGSKVAIVVDDPSRWTPVRDALPIALGRLHDSGVNAEDVTICAGVGRHHAVEEPAMRARVGDSIFERYACLSPPVDELSKYVDLGETSGGLPVRVFEPVARADRRILIGSTLPHLQAGFGGGYKLIFPGTSHRSTLAALHRQGIEGGEAGRRLGEDPRLNPMRSAIREAAAKLGPCVSINHLLGAPGEVFDVVVGPPDLVQDRMAREAKRRFRAPDAAPADVVVAGNNPWPGDPMQSFKVLLNHRAAGRPGGVMVGFFWASDEEMDRSFSLSAMKAIGATGAVGGWTIRRGLAMADRVASALHPASEFMIRWARELVVDRSILVFSPPLRRAIGPRLGPIQIFDDQADLWRATAKALGGPPGSIRVFPRAGLTYAPDPSAKEPT